MMLNSSMLKTKKVIDDMLYYDISPNVTAFSTTRQGGFSCGKYAEMNINRHCGDDPTAIEKNLEALSRELNVSKEHIIMPHQTHGTEVRRIAKDFLSLPNEVQAMLLEGVDALTTDMKGVCIGVSTADCIPIIIYDSEHYAASTIHAGWRGTVARIAQKAVAEMRLSYGSRPETLKAVVGPGISVDAFEVGDEVYDEFSQAGFDMNSISHRTNKWHIDLPECNRQQLLETGICAGNITMSGVCTYNNADRFFSARRLGVSSGRIFTGILMH